MLNLKPARFGSVRALFDTYDYCAAHGIDVYGGGMFEQGPGRGQLQYLASLFHPGTPNDLAPAFVGPPTTGAARFANRSATRGRSGRRPSAFRRRYPPSER
jgi:hypothetical protein